jgi:MFS family permease
MRPDGTARAADLVQATTASSAATAMVMLPVFLTAALSIPIRAQLGFDELGLGVAISAFFGVSALASVAGGWLAQRIGAGRCVAIGGSLSLLATTGVALLGTRLVHLVILLSLAGVANAIVQPGASLVLAQVVPVYHQGLAFGVNQVSPPLAAMLAGVTVPTVALTVGWRWAFVAPLVLGAVVWGAWPRGLADNRDAPTGSGRPPRIAGHPELLVLTAATTLGSTATQALVAFFVESAVVGGMSPGHAGWLLGAGSVGGVAARLVCGWLADRRGGDRLSDVAILMAVGSVGLLGLATQAGALLPAATALAFAAGWGWNGLLSYAVVRRNPANPALALGVATTGVFIGGVLGPLGFGLLARQASYSLAWSATAVALLLAGCLVLLAVRLGKPHPRHRTCAGGDLLKGNQSR